MTDAARAPKELMRRSFISAKEQAKEAAERQQPQSEQPEQYAEERVERTADDVVLPSSSCAQTCRKAP